ncbi:hypothetical protein F5B22DRAFT_109475 [Xylaria bambusicola]|uniref:uncharacterized protein n=1 Tax=Xylaria bambusicola TaxID=326684 RepID=UPI002008CBC7|nr:uncharacterized protein F5B22DRAFT_109475 [Xylaria bambusicola]KAI0517543.1 hypothetical protein F5B22DRAFT_109475 [Xylaria bambusicola]
MTRPSTASQSHSTKPHDEPTITELLTLKKFRDAKNLPISNNELFKHVGVSRSTGYRILRDYPQRFHREPCEETRGRRPALTDAQVDQLVAFLEAEDYDGRTLPWVELCDAAGLEFPTQSKRPTSQTVSKHLNKRGWKKCVACSRFWVDYDMASPREAPADQGLDIAAGGRVLYSNEVHFKSKPEVKASITQQPDERSCTHCVQHHQRSTESRDRQAYLVNSTGSSVN